MNNRKHFVSTCVSLTALGENVYEVITTKPDDFAFSPGQYVFWSVPLAGNNHDVQNRAFSLASAPTEPNLRFIIKTFTEGRASTFVRNILTQGMKLEMYGPFGNFILNTQSKNHICIATSTGVAPFRSFIEHNLYTKSDEAFHLLYSVQTEAEIFWYSNFQDLLSKHNTNSLILTITKPQDSWQGKTGRVINYLPSLLEKFPDATVYICGNPAMVQQVRELLIDTYHWPKDRIRFEKY